MQSSAGTAEARLFADRLGMDSSHVWHHDGVMYASEAHHAFPYAFLSAHDLASPLHGELHARAAIIMMTRVRAR